MLRKVKVEHLIHTSVISVNEEIYHSLLFVIHSEKTHIYKTFLREPVTCMIQDNVISDLMSTLPPLKCEKRSHDSLRLRSLRSDVNWISRGANSVVSVWVWSPQNQESQKFQFERQQVWDPRTANVSVQVWRQEKTNVPAKVFIWLDGDHSH